MRLGDYQCTDALHIPKVVFIWCTEEEMAIMPKPVYVTDARDRCNNELLVEIENTIPNLVALTLLGLDVRRLRI